MTDGDEGIARGGHRRRPGRADTTDSTVTTPGGAGPWRGRGPEERAAALETADTVEVPEPWRRPRPVASTRSWPAPVTVTDARADSPSSTLTRDTPAPVVERPTIGWRAIVVRRGPSLSLRAATATFSSPTGGSDTDYAVDATRSMNVAVHAGAGAAPGS